MVSAIAAARYFSHGSARVFLPSGYRALVKRCNLLRGASGRERHSNPPALCSFDFYGLKLAMKPSKFHYKIFELHSLHNKTPFRKFWLSYTMFYPWNATVLRHKLFNRVYRDFYARKRDLSASPRFHIYFSICVGRLDLRCARPRNAAACRAALPLERRVVVLT